MTEGGFLPDSEVLGQMVSIFERANPESKERLFHALAIYLGFSDISKSQRSTFAAPLVDSAGIVAKFTEDRSLSAKEFISQKQPRTDVERVACLAYYLTHYINKPHFKTIDISRANTEAAQIKFSNPAVAVDNATAYGYLVPAGKGFKQISAIGEQYVAALPDREAAKEVMSHRRRPRRKSRKNDVRSGK